MKGNSIKTNPTPWLFAASGILGLALLFAAALAPEHRLLALLLGGALLATLGAIARLNRRALRSRAIAHGTHSAVTAVLVVSILGVLNFVGARNPAKLDLTRNKLHTLSEQTRKVISGLGVPLKLVYFAKAGQREQIRPLLENYQGLNASKVSIEYIDPDKEPARARQAGIKKYGTLQLLAGARDTQVEDPNEEKITNALLKILKENAPELCVLSGHGEKSFSSAEADGFDAMRQALAAQAYLLKDLNLVTSGKIPSSCSAVLVWGSSKAFFRQEIELLSEHLKAGGRMLLGLDLAFSGNDPATELNALLEPWGVRLDRALLVDPAIRALELDSSVLISNQFSREHPITRELTTGAALPFARPVVRTAARLPESIKIQELLSTSPKAWAESDLKGLASGKARFDAGSDTMGVLSPAVAIEGKPVNGPASRPTRLVVFGSAMFAANNVSRMLNNSDLFLNAAAWVIDDSTGISVRPKEQEAGRLELTERDGALIFLVTVVVMPLLVASAGIGFWAIRRKL